MLNSAEKLLKFAKKFLAYGLLKYALFGASLVKEKLRPKESIRNDHIVPFADFNS